MVAPSPATTTTTDTSTTSTTATSTPSTTAPSPSTPSTTTTATTTPEDSSGQLPPLARAIVGTAGDDVLTGTPGPDVVLGLGGNDTIHGLGGNDALIGGEGDDALFGDGGDDRLDAGPGRDSVHGGTGNDRLAIVDEAVDVVADGGPGVDRVYADTEEGGSTRPPNVYSTAVEARYFIAARPIVFVATSSSFGNGAFASGTIELMDANGGNVIALMPKSKKGVGTYDQSPRWSPDGTQVAFARGRMVGGKWRSDLLVVNWDGTGLTSVTTTPDLCEQRPSWSPDGTRLVYYVEPCPGEERVAQKALDPAAPVTYLSGENDFEDVEWRADGAFVYAGTCTGAHGGVYRMDAWTPNSSTDFEDPPGEQRTPSNGNQCAPFLSLSNSVPFQLLFQTYSSSRPLKKSDLQIRSKADSAPPSVWGTNLTFKKPPAHFWGMDPDWSSDGKHIVFMHTGIWKMNADGTGKQPLGPGSEPDWR